MASVFKFHCPVGVGLLGMICFLLVVLGPR